MGITTRMIRLLIFSVLVVVCFAGINDYNVYHSAPNSGKNWDSIQGAVNQAIADGYTCQSGRRVRVVIQASEVPYGTPGNTVQIPCSIWIQGELAGNFPGAKVYDHLYFTNLGSSTTSGYWSNPLIALQDLFWAHGGVNFIQLDVNTPCVTYDFYDQTYNMFPMILVLENVYFNTVLNNTVAPMVDIRWDGSGYLLNTVFFSVSYGTHLINLHRGSGLDLINSELSAKLFINSEGTGVPNPNTNIDIMRNDIAYQQKNIGDPSSVVSVLTMQYNGADFVQFLGNDILYLPNASHTAPMYMLNASNFITTKFYFADNQYEMTPNGGPGPFVVYNCLNSAALKTGENSLFFGGFNGVNALNLLPSSTI